MSIWVKNMKRRKNGENVKEKMGAIKGKLKFKG
jgi:hypothetical protein